METWRQDPRIAARGFVHAYDSSVEDGNGEDFFIELLDGLIDERTDLLDVGCGHGELTLSLAKRARSAIGVDRDAVVIGLARELAEERGVLNVRFEQAELAGPTEDRAGGPLPVDAQSVNLVVNRRGPVLERYADDLRRVGRPGTVVVGLHPAGGPPAPPWVDELPTFRHRFGAIDAAVVASWVVDAAERRSLHDYRLWWLDVPEWLPSPAALYDKLTFDGAPPFETVREELHGIFERHGVDGRVLLRHQRLAYTVRLPG
jgi:SAM-dependent methyltransferase